MNSYSVLQNLQKDFENAQKQLTRGEYAEALRLFTEILNSDPTHRGSIDGKVNALTVLGQQAIENKDWVMAEFYWKAAHQLAPLNTNIIEKLAFVRRQMYLKKNIEISSIANKQLTSSPRIDNLIFQGGGIKGLAYVGALDALYECIDMTKIKRFGGTSAGAINALLLGLDYSQKELQILLKEIDFAKVLMDGEFKEKLLKLNARSEELKAKGNEIADKFKKNKNSVTSIFGVSTASAVLSKVSVDPDFKMIKEGFALLTQEDFGLFPGDVFREEWVESLIQAKTGIAYTTFRELHDLGFKDIYFVGANISTEKAEVFSYETTPDAIVSDALRISMSIPLVFKPHQLYIKEKGRRILHPNQAWYVDGGLIDNYPLWLFDKACYWKNSPVIPQALSRNPFTLGLRLTTAEHKAVYEGEALEKISSPPTSLSGFLWSVFQTLYSKQNSDHVKLQEQDRTIYIDYLGIKTTQFDLNEKDQQALIKSGYEAAKSYFQKRFTPNEQTPLDKAIEENCKPLILSLVAHGMYACQNPEKVHVLLQEAAKCEWIDTVQILEDLAYFEAYHQEALQLENNSNSKCF